MTAKAPMPRKTLVALRGSIKKWEGVAFGGVKDEGPDNCPLCAEFYKNDDGAEVDCNGCPVRTKTKKPYCLGTPYVEWVETDNYNGFAVSVDSIIAAAKMLFFLQSLLPK